MLLPIDPEFYDAVTDDSFDDFIRRPRKPRHSHYRGIASKYKKRKFPAPTRGRAPQSIFISPKRLRELRLQQSKKKSNTPSEKAKPKTKKTTANSEQKPKVNAAKMAAAKKAMESDTKAAKPAKIIAVVVAITGTAVFGYLVWKQHKKQIV